MLNIIYSKGVLLLTNIILFQGYYELHFKINMIVTNQKLVFPSRIFIALPQIPTRCDIDKYKSLVSANNITQLYIILCTRVI